MDGYSPHYPPSKDLAISSTFSVPIGGDSKIQNRQDSFRDGLQSAKLVPISQSQTEDNGATNVLNTFVEPLSRHENLPPLHETKIASKRSPTSLDPEIGDVIDLVDADELVTEATSVMKPVPTSSFSRVVHDRKRDRNEIGLNASPPHLHYHAPSVQSLHDRRKHTPEWMKSAAKPNQPGTILSTFPTNDSSGMQQHKPPLPPINIAIPLVLPPEFRPSWTQLLPNKGDSSNNSTKERRAFKLSLLNVNEFTITGISPSWNQPPTSTAGLRRVIKSIAREHGKAVYERDTGQWRIPLGAYHALAAYLESDRRTSVEGIPPHQLQVASIERARQERGYPTAERLVELGLPKGLAHALAPFQRGGVDFVISKGGRALIADDMGLGKTIQGVASMVFYYQEWPLLVLSPSGARYHWEIEFQQWLGKESLINQHSDSHAKEGMLLDDSQIRVLTCGRDEIFPSMHTRVVICSYGLVQALVESGRLVPGMFRCAIVDESHMLKNKSTKRTQALLPLLTATNRCVLLSGTPALARPAELWPQLMILSSNENKWWHNEDEFNNRYVKSADSQTRAELHALLTGTVMIRRLKSDILKSLPRKLREKAELRILTPEQHAHMANLMSSLREGKGMMSRLARQYHEEDGAKYDAQERNDLTNSKNTDDVEVGLSKSYSYGLPQSSGDVQEQFQKEVIALNTSIKKDLDFGRNCIRRAIQDAEYYLPVDQREAKAVVMETDLRTKLKAAFERKMMDTQAKYGTHEVTHANVFDVARGSNDGQSRDNVLSELYALAGKAKIPLVVDLLKRWLKDPTKGKLCIFAHHIAVLDAIAKDSGLSNVQDSKTKYIRIDGSTKPEIRQQQIKDFQTDPSIRIALLGITAAGVAVTLTASSNVWFAELFWTPAIMIQAEDRCHRIGQQARVRCLYFVARGTLDEILWRLIEKKFSELGEFVEGKEKLKLVIDKTYNRLQELHDLFTTESDLQDFDFDSFLDDQDGEEPFPLDEDLVHDIEAMGEEEGKILQMMADGNDESRPISPEVSDDLGKEAGLGTTEDDAIEIVLSDDDDDVADTRQQGDNLSETMESAPFESLLPNPRFYKIYVVGPNAGIEISLVCRRVVVNYVAAGRLQALGAKSKPSVGDVLASMNGQNLSQVQDLSPIVAAFQHGLSKGHVELIFMEDPVFLEYYASYMKYRRRRKAEERKARNDILPKSHGPTVTDIIEID